MRNTLPAMVHVQTEFAALAGQIGIGVEGSNATVKGDDRWHGNSANDLALPILEPYGPATRYIDVFSRGVEDCDWSLAADQPWLKLDPAKGTLGPDSPDTRVLVSVDWKAVPAGFDETVTVNVTTCPEFDAYGFSDAHVLVPVRARAVPKSFTKGFVESDGHVAFPAAKYSTIIQPSSSSKSTKVKYHTFTNYGRTDSGVGLTPLNTEKLTITTAPALEYDLYLFTNTSAANVTLYLSPGLNYLGDATPLEYAISLFPAGAEKPPVTHVQPVGATVGGNMPAGWQGAVADGVWGRTGNYTTSRFEVAKEGAYKLRVWTLLPGLVVQKVVVDLGGVRPSYLGPPTSFLVGEDVVGERRGVSAIY